MTGKLPQQSRQEANLCPLDGAVCLALRCIAGCDMTPSVERHRDRRTETAIDLSRDYPKEPWQ